MSYPALPDRAIPAYSLPYWALPGLVVGAAPSDSFFNPDPDIRPTAVLDIFTNTRHNVGGDVWYDVIDESAQDTSWAILHDFIRDTSWDILNESSQDIAWDVLTAFALNTAWGILGSNSQDISWSVFARTLYFIQQFFLKEICYNFKIKHPLLFNRQIIEALEFTYRPTSVITETVNLALSDGVVVMNTIGISSAVPFTFQIKEPTIFTTNVDRVLKGESTEYPA